MSKSPVATNAHDAPKLTRRAALTGMAAAAVASGPALAADRPSPVAELIADYHFAREEYEHAAALADKIRGEMQSPRPRVCVGNLLSNGGKEPIYVYCHYDIDLRAEQINIVAVPQWHERAELARALWHKTLSEAEEVYNSEADRRGLRQADDVEERAWHAKMAARDAVLTYPCRTVADYEARDGFVRDLIRIDQLTDDVVDLVFGATLPLLQQP